MNQHLKLQRRNPIVPLSADGMADRTAVAQRVIVPTTSTPLAEPFIRRVWPLATIVFGLAVTVVWMSLLGYLLGYVLVILIGLVI
jgi:hypothetical protein